MDKIEVKNIVVLQRENAADFLFIEAALPNACYPFEGDAVLTLHAARNAGEEYARKHFPNTNIEVKKC